MKILATASLFFILSASLFAVPIYDNGLTEEHLFSRWITNAGVSQIDNSVIIQSDNINQRKINLQIYGNVDTTSFWMNEFNTLISTSAPGSISINYSGMADGQVFGNIYNNDPFPNGVINAEFAGDHEFRVLEILLTNTVFPNTITLTDFNIQGNVHHLPEPSSEFLIVFGVILLLIVFAFEKMWDRD